MSALESMFTAKPSSSKAEKGKSEKPQDANDAGREEVSPKLNRLTMIDTDGCMALHKLGDGVGGLLYKIDIHNNQNFKRNRGKVPELQHVIFCHFHI